MVPRIIILLLIIGSKSIHFMIICSQLSIFFGDLLQLIPLATLSFCCLLLSTDFKPKQIANSLDPDQDRHVSPGLEANRLTLIVFQKEFFEKVSFEKSQQTTTAYKV